MTKSTDAAAFAASCTADAVRALADAEAHVAAGRFEPAACDALAALTFLRFALYLPNGADLDALPVDFYFLDGSPDVQTADAPALLAAAREKLLAGDLPGADRLATDAMTALALREAGRKPSPPAPRTRRSRPTKAA